MICAVKGDEQAVNPWGWRGRADAQSYMGDMDGVGIFIRLSAIQEKL